MYEERETFEPASLSILAMRSSERVRDVFVFILPLYYQGRILAKGGCRKVVSDSIDMCITCTYHSSMSKMIQLRHVPDALHRQLKARAALSGLPLSDYLIREVRKIAEQPTPDEMRERLQRRDPYRGKSAPTDLVRAERDSR
jgi:hypothetical protein